MEGDRFAKSLWGKLDREVRETSGHDSSTSRPIHTTMCLHSFLLTNCVCVKNKYLTEQCQIQITVVYYARAESSKTTCLKSFDFNFAA